MGLMWGFRRSAGSSGTTLPHSPGRTQLREPKMTQALPVFGKRTVARGTTVRDDQRRDHSDPARYHQGVAELWDPGADGVLRLPSGRLLRGRGLSRPAPAGLAGPVPEFALYLLGQEPPAVDWPSRWVRWPDFRLPADRAAAREAFEEAWRRAESERVEVACAGGRGRTGTALACIAVLDGVPPAEDVGSVRTHPSPHAVETPWQAHFVRRFAR